MGKVNEPWFMASLSTINDSNDREVKRGVESKHTNEKATVMYTIIYVHCTIQRNVEILESNPYHSDKDGGSKDIGIAYTLFSL